MVGLISAVVRKYPPQYAATYRGHVDQQRSNQRSTQPREITPAHAAQQPASDAEHDPIGVDDACPPDPPAMRSRYLYADCQMATGVVFTDPTRRFLTPLWKSLDPIQSLKQGQFVIHWQKGTDNLADYFTKHHSPAQHYAITSFT
jgi:hypothetical protein